MFVLYIEILTAGFSMLWISLHIFFKCLDVYSKIFIYFDGNEMRERTTNDFSM